MKQWKLNEIGNIECTMDNSGVYTIISRIEKKSTHKQYTGVVVTIRVDVMGLADEPLQSFVGKGNDVRKAVIAYLLKLEYEYRFDGVNISEEHYSYIGYEISRAMTTENYIQDWKNLFGDSRVKAVIA